MEKEQLDILLKHGELWTNEDYQYYFSNKYVKDPKGQFGLKESKSFKGNHLVDSEFEITIQGVEYNLDMKLYKVLERLFEWYLVDFVADETDFYKEDIKQKLRIYSPLKEDKIRFFGEAILEENERLESLIGKISRWNTIEGIIGLWCFDILEKGEDLIQCLKFDVLNGEKIENFGFPSEKHLPNFYKLEKYFQTEKIEKIFTCHAIAENINYLKKLIEDLESPIEKALAEKSILRKTSIEEQLEQSGNEIILSKIEDWLFEFKEKMTEADYDLLVSSLEEYFKTGKFPKLNRVIKVNSVNKKIFGWNLNKLYKEFNSNALPKEYLLFANKNISLFTNDEFNELNMSQSNLYRYFTTNPKNF